MVLDIEKYLHIVDYNSKSSNTMPCLDLHLWLESIKVVDVELSINKPCKSTFFFAKTQIAGFAQVKDLLFSLKHNLVQEVQIERMKTNTCRTIDDILYETYSSIFFL